MSKDTLLFIGLDTHKESISVAYVEEERSSECQHYGKIPTTKTALAKLARHFTSRFPQATLHFVYEAGPCGYWVYRYLTSLGHCCYVIAPSLVPKKPGDRVKTDRRDAQMLAQRLKQNDLSPIYVPEPEDEAIRDLSRARETAMRDLNSARYQLKACLLRNHIQYDGAANWSQKHIRWLTSLILPHPCQHIVLQEHLHTVGERQSRLERLDNELAHHVQSWRFYPVVKAIQAMRGVKIRVATGVITELGDLTRFDHPSKLMAYLGLVPTEHSSGMSRRTGGITKCGNGRARRLLVEGAHSYRFPAKVSLELQKRQEDLPKEIVDIAWEAQLRLCRRYARLMHRGKHRNVVVAAIAREMVAYMWAIAQEVVLPPVDPKQRLSRIEG